MGKPLVILDDRCQFDKVIKLIDASKVEGTSSHGVYVYLSISGIIRRAYYG